MDHSKCYLNRAHQQVCSSSVEKERPFWESTWRERGRRERKEREEGEEEEEEGGRKRGREEEEVEEGEGEGEEREGEGEGAPEISRVEHSPEVAFKKKHG